VQDSHRRDGHVAPHHHRPGTLVHHHSGGMAGIDGELLQRGNEVHRMAAELRWHLDRDQSGVVGVGHLGLVLPKVFVYRPGDARRGEVVRAPQLETKALGRLHRRGHPLDDGSIGNAAGRRVLTV